MRRTRGSVPDEAGQGLVELALILPVFLLVLFGIFDVGRAVYTNSALSQAAREGARLAAVEAAWVGAGLSDHPRCVRNETELLAKPGGRVCPGTLADLKSHVVDAVNRMAVSLGPISAVHLSCNAGIAGDPTPTGAWTESSGGNGCDDGAGQSLATTGQLVSIRVEYVYQPFTPIVSSLIGSIALSGSASMEVN